MGFNGIISNSLAELEAIDQKLNNYMKQNVNNYNAKQWGRIVEHPTISQKYLYVINDDERKPLELLTTSERTNRKSFNDVEWDCHGVRHTLNHINNRKFTKAEIIASRGKK